MGQGSGWWRREWALRSAGWQHYATNMHTHRTACRYGSQCTRTNCYYSHPGRAPSKPLQLCRYGPRCTRSDCWYGHPQGRYIDADQLDDNVTISATSLTQHVGHQLETSGTRRERNERTGLSGERLLRFGGADQQALFGREYSGRRSALQPTVFYERVQQAAFHTPTDMDLLYQTQHCWGNSTAVWPAALNDHDNESGEDMDDDLSLALAMSLSLCSSPVQRLSGQDECVVCQEPLDDQGEAVLPCGHCFHETCLNSWLDHDRTCPLCRATC